MTDYLAEIKRLRWKAVNAKSEFWQGYYTRYADRLQREFDKKSK